MTRDEAPAHTLRSAHEPLPDAAPARGTPTPARPWMSCCETLEALARELRRYGIHATLVPDQGVPYVRAQLSGTAGKRVEVGRAGGDDVFAWPDGQHPVIDPAGARRMATQLRGERHPGGRS